MAVDSAMEVQEAAVSSATAIPCLILLSSRFGVHLDTENVDSRQQFHGATLSISELIQLANDFGFDARYIRRDWPWLQLALATQPILLLLRNGNTIVSVGTGRTGAEEIVVCDPLHRGGIPIILSRENIERVWDGDTLAIVPNSLAHETSGPNGYPVISEELPDKTRIAQRFWKTLGVITVCLGSMVPVLTLTTSPITDSPLIFQKPGSPLPAIATLHRSSFANQAGHHLASGETVNAMPSEAGPPGSSGIAAATSPRADLGTLVLAEIGSNTAMSLSLGSPPAREGSGLSRDETLSASDVAALLARGDDQLRLGDFTSARLFYEAAADTGDANAALKLGETFDPIFIDRVNLRGVRADMERAVFWYRRARDLGSSAAAKLLKDLAPNPGASIGTAPKN